MGALGMGAAVLHALVLAMYAGQGVLEHIEIIGQYWAKGYG